MKKILALTFALVLCLGMFVACGINADKAAQNLKDEGYEVEEFTGEDAAVMGIKGKVTKVIVGMKDKENITIVVFENTDDAKAYFETIDEQYSKLKDAAEEAGEKLDGDWGRDGAVVYEGTKAAVKAAK